MSFRLKTAIAATSFVLLSQPYAEANQQSVAQQQQQQGQRGGPPGGQRGRGGLPNPENERRIRQAVQNRMREVLALPDSTITRLSAITFRYRDSSLVMLDRERFLRREMEFERGGGRPNRAPNDQRISCLMSNYWVVQESLLAMRVAEDREVAAILSGPKRVQYFGLQENLHETIDRVRENFERNRDGGQGRGGPAGPRSGGGAVGPDGRPLGPPPQGARGPGGPAGRAGLMALCPPRREGGGGGR